MSHEKGMVSKIAAGPFSVWLAIGSVDFTRASNGTRKNQARWQLALSYGLGEQQNAERR